MTKRQIYNLVELKVNDAFHEYSALINSPDPDFYDVHAAFRVYTELSNLLSDIREEIMKDRYNNLSKIQKLVAYNIDAINGIPASPDTANAHVKVANIFLKRNDITLEDVLHYHDDFGISYSIMDGILFSFT